MTHILHSCDSLQLNSCCVLDKDNTGPVSEIHSPVGETEIQVKIDKLKLRALRTNRGKVKGSENTREELSWLRTSKQDINPVGAGLKAEKIVQAEDTGAHTILGVNTSRPKK